jgi:signal transduction histidine kinase
MTSLTELWNRLAAAGFEPEPEDDLEPLYQREQRVIHVINNVKIILYAFYGTLDLTYVIFFSREPHSLLEILLYLAILAPVFGALIAIYRATATSPYRRWPLYLTIGIDYFTIASLSFYFAPAVEQFDFSAREFMLAMSLFIIIVNVVITFTGSRRATLIASLCGCLLNTVNFMHIGAGWLFTMYTTVGIGALGIFNHVVASFIKKNHVLTTRLDGKNRRLHSTLTQLRQAQERLIESEKMATVGSLVTGISHEINSPLGVAVTASSDLKRNIVDFTGAYKRGAMTHSSLQTFLKDSYEELRLVEKNLERASRLVQEFKQVSADQMRDDSRTVDLREYLEEIVDSLRPATKPRRVEVALTCPASLSLETYPGLFAQILTNLVINSLTHGFAGSQGGRIGITVKRDGDTGLDIHYADTGTGIAEQHRPAIFEPFFTTDKQHCTGLGMHIIRTIVVQKLNGRIAIDPSHTRGAAFRIWLPVTEKQGVLHHG